MSDEARFEAIKLEAIQKYGKKDAEFADSVVWAFDAYLELKERLGAAERKKMRELDTAEKARLEAKIGELEEARRRASEDAFERTRTIERLIQHVSDRDDLRAEVIRLRRQTCQPNESTSTKTNSDDTSAESS
jgi:hypothetical protein